MLLNNYKCSRVTVFTGYLSGLYAVNIVDTDIICVNIYKKNIEYNK